MATNKPEAFIAVLVHRPEAQEVAEESMGNSEPLDGVEVWLFPTVREDSVHELINEMADLHPDWHFDITPGITVMEPEDVTRLYADAS